MTKQSRICTTRLLSASANAGRPRNDDVKVFIAFALVQIQHHFALITFYSAPEDFISAFRASVAGLFILNPFFGTNLSPIRNSTQDNLFANRHREIFNMLTRKSSALMTTGVAFFSCAGPDLALSAVHELFIG